MGIAHLLRGGRGLNGVQRLGGEVRVVEVFHSLQGEGVWAGVPMTFMRLAGCNAPGLGLGCVSWCDTRGSWDERGGRLLSVEELLGRVRYRRVCVTGGEPLLQAAGVAKLVAALAEREVRVHLETNGTLDWPQGEAVPAWVTVSPKPPLYGMAAGIAAMAAEVKIIYDAEMDAVSAGSASHLVAGIANRAPGAVICIQPEAGGGAQLAGRAAAFVLDHPEWRLSLQVHKILGIR